MWCILLFYYSQLHDLDYETAFLFGYDMMYNSFEDNKEQGIITSLHWYCKAAPNHHSLT